MTQKLVRIPQPQPWESPSSWVSRCALSQGVLTNEFLRHLDVDASGDIDLNVIRADQKRLTDVCDLPSDYLPLSRLLLPRLVSAGVDTKRFLLSSTKGAKPRYRFCPHCLQDQREPHFPVHWRFTGFRYCKLHHCMLEDRCHVCNSTVTMPANQLQAGPDGKGIAYLKHCMSCGVDLCKGSTLSTREAFSLLSAMERTLMTNGLAVLRALLEGYLFKDTAEKKLPLSTLCRLDQQLLLPHQENWLTVAILRGRLVQRMRRRATERQASRGEHTGPTRGDEAVGEH